MPPEPLTDDEIAKLRTLLPYAEIVREEAEYDAAVRLLIRRWKSIVVGIAAVVAALAVIASAVRTYWQHLIAN